MVQTIKDILSSDNSIDRKIEKVIDYGMSGTEQLKEEVSEYVVTEAIDKSFSNLLEQMQYGMDGQGAKEIGVWVSGFYGSGKSSFTKYLGCAFEQVEIEGKPFHELLAARFSNTGTRALLNTTVSRYPAAVIKLDLATQQMGTDVEEISDILFRSIRKQFGYAHRSDEVFAFEQMVKQDNRWEELLETSEKICKRKWPDIHNHPFLIKGAFHKIAKAMYPELEFQGGVNPSQGKESDQDFTDVRLQLMVDLVRRETGKENIIFIIDEVGQYAGSRPKCILDLDGTAKVLKRIGDGHIWIIATAQQTLTDDSQAAAINSPELYKLKDRFPVSVSLPATDIKEICYRRLLGKSGEGCNWLAQSFKDHNQTLRSYTTMQDARVYQDGELTEKDLLQYYPFLPWHFELLINLLRVLARTTGGIGLRSAIKVVQDILVGRYTDDRFYNQPAGTLVTLADIYDELYEDIEKADPALSNIMNRLAGSNGLYKNDVLAVNVAKALAVLYILADPGCPALPKNIAALLVPSIDSPSLESKVIQILNDMASRKDVPVSLAADGRTYTFLSEKLDRIERERTSLNITRGIINSNLNEGMRDVLPKVSVKVSDALSCGIEITDEKGQTIIQQNGGIRLYLKWIEPGNQEDQLLNEDLFIREKGLDKAASLVCSYTEELEDLLRDIASRQEICKRHLHDPDKDIKQYCTTQQGVISAKKTELQKQLQSIINNGIILHKGTRDAVSQLGGNLKAAMTEVFTDIAKGLYNRNSEAVVRVDTQTAEHFLRAKDKASLTSKQDPLTLVTTVNGKTQFNQALPAIKSLKEFLTKGGTTGKALIDHFSEAPYGWSKDTTLYLLAGLFWGEELELTIGAKTYKAENDTVFNAFRNTTAIGKVGIQGRTGKIEIDQIMEVSEFLSPFCGTVGLTEKEICQAAVEFGKSIHNRLAEIRNEAEELGLDRADWLEKLQESVLETVSMGGSNIFSLVCSPNSRFKDQMAWYLQVAKAKPNGIFNAIRQYEEGSRKLKIIRGEQLDDENRKKAESLSDRNKALLALLASPGWVDAKLDFQQFADDIDVLEKAVLQYKADLLSASREKAAKNIKMVSGWEQLTLEKQAEILNTLPIMKSVSTIDQANQLLANLQAKQNAAIEAVEKALVVPPVKVRIKKKLRTVEDLDAMVTKLQGIRNRLTENGKTVINLEWED